MICPAHRVWSDGGCIGLRADPVQTGQPEVVPDGDENEGAGPGRDNHCCPWRTLSLGISGEKRQPVEHSNPAHTNTPSTIRLFIADDVILRSPDEAASIIKCVCVCVCYAWKAMFTEYLQ